MIVSRMQHWIKVLQKVENEKRELNMGTWAEKKNCNTVACAAGWAAFDETFNKEGLRLVEEVRGEWAPYFDFEYGVAAIARFFDIKPAAAASICYSSYYTKPAGKITTTDVIDQIRRVMADPDAPCGFV